MNKQKLINEIEKLNSNNVYLLTLYKIYAQENKAKFIAELKEKYKEVFNVNFDDEKFLKNRKGLYLAIRASFFWICNDFGIRSSNIPKYVNKHHSTILNSIEQYSNLIEQHPTIQDQINEIKVWYLERNNNN